MKNDSSDNIEQGAEQVKFGNISPTFVKQILFAAAVDAKLCSRNYKLS